MIQHRLGPPDVGQDRIQPRADGPQRAAVCGDHRVDVDVDHSCGGVNAADRVMHAGRARGDATSQIDELPDPLFCDVPDRALPELPVHPGGQRGLRSRPSRSPISRLGTLSAQVTLTKVRLTLVTVHRFAAGCDSPHTRSARVHRYESPEDPGASLSAHQA